MQVKWVKTVPDAQIPSYAHEGDAGFDLVASKRVFVFPFQKKIVPTGLKVELPRGFELQVRPRSGVSLKKPISIANSPGTIDSNYRGEVGIIVHHVPLVAQWALWMFLIALGMVIATSSHIGSISSMSAIGGFSALIALGLLVVVMATPYLVKKGDRIAQGVICALPEVEHFVVSEDELSVTTRGAGGFGSTGSTKLT